MCVTSCFSFVKARFVFNTILVFPSFVKYGLLYLQSSSVIYQFKYECNTNYMGRTNFWLSTRITQDMPAYIRHGGDSNSNRLTPSVCESAIERHLIKNTGCASEYVDEAFRLLHRDQSVELRIFKV